MATALTRVTAPIFLEKNHKYKYEVNRASSVYTKLKLTTGRSFRATSGLLTTSSVEVSRVMYPPKYDPYPGFFLLTRVFMN
jgi:hypothetical protein